MGWVIGTLALAVVGVLIGKGGLNIAFMVIGIFPAMWVLSQSFTKPGFAAMGVLIIGFLNNGLSRYAELPWGLMIDGLLIIGWLGILVSWKKYDFKLIQNSFIGWSMAWYVVVIFQLVNPRTIGPEAWFYAMRAMGFYQLLMLGLLFMTINHRRFYNQLIHGVLILSAMGSVWGIKQHFLGLDSAEERWLYVGGYAMTHILAGVLRVFSFYSDAGQFGAAQAMVFTISVILIIGEIPVWKKILYGISAALGLYGFLISGTRGALAVVVAGIIAWLIVVRNIRLLTMGSVVSGSLFFLLKYTFVMQGVEQVRRMRSALDPNDASLQVRHMNQKIFANYLADKPFGGGIGSVGYWGNRFAPNSFLAQMPTDSYFVKVWVETGVVGTAVHLMMFGFFIGRCGRIVINLRDPLLRQQCIAMYAGFCGIMLANYGNQVYSQTPSSIICFIALVLIFMAPKFDTPVQPPPTPPEGGSTAPATLHR